MEAAIDRASAGSTPEVASGQIRRVESSFGGRPPGPRLFRASWSPPDPKRVLVLVHGFGEHCQRYDEFAVWFARRQCMVHSFDLRGHGRSQGRRGHVDSFSEYHTDLAELIDLIRLEHPNLPRTLIGHSLGGLIVSSYVRERSPQDLESLVTSGALLSLSPDLSKLKMLLAKVLGRILPRLSMDAGIDTRQLSRDLEVVRRYDEDPLVHGRTSASLGAEMLAAIKRTYAGGGDFQLPTMLLHGEEDRLCLMVGSEAFYESLPGASGGKPLARLRTYPGMKHEIFNEIDKEGVYEDVLQWILSLESRMAGTA